MQLESSDRRTIGLLTVFNRKFRHYQFIEDRSAGIPSKLWPKIASFYIRTPARISRKNIFISSSGADVTFQLLPRRKGPNFQPESGRKRSFFSVGFYLNQRTFLGIRLDSRLLGGLVTFCSFPSRRKKIRFWGDSKIWFRPRSPWQRGLTWIRATGFAFDCLFAISPFRLFLFFSLGISDRWRMAEDGENRGKFLSCSCSGLYRAFIAPIVAKAPRRADPSSLLPDARSNRESSFFLVLSRTLLSGADENDMSHC